LFLGRPVKAPQIKRVENSSKAKVANLVHVRHRDEVEAPLTDWLREAYELPDRLAAAGAASKAVRTKPRSPAKKAGTAKEAKAGTTGRKKTAQATKARAAARTRKGARGPGR
jgi:hypothetical protein